MDYHAAAKMMDAQVDNRLGDPLFYSIQGAPAVAVRGFVIDPSEAAAEGLDVAIDTVGPRLRVKINRDFLETPHRLDRLRADPAHPGAVPLLEDREWKPTGYRPVTAGRYWLFDIVKV